MATKYLQSELRDWAMLGVDWEKVKNPIMYPCYVQPKLNGVRAKWDGPRQIFVSRQGQEWPEHVIPHLYEKYRGVQESFDGELFCKSLMFQEITERVGVARTATHEDVKRVTFWRFDTINDKLAEWRQVGTDVGYDVCHSEAEVMASLDVWTKMHYEGLIIRQLGLPYIPNRTEALIKLKPWCYERGRIIGFTEGLGKYAGTLGAIQLRSCNANGNLTHDGKWLSQLGRTVEVTFFAGGGPGFTDALRATIWNSRSLWLGRDVLIRYRELSRANIPLQPQLLL